MVVVVSCFRVRNDKDDEVHQAFVDRPRLVDDVPGFLGLEVFRGEEDPKEFWLLTRWSDEETYREWHKGHTYKDSHKGIPKGLKLVKGSTKITVLRRIAE